MITSTQNRMYLCIKTHYPHAACIRACIRGVWAGPEMSAMNRWCEGVDPLGFDDWNLGMPPLVLEVIQYEHQAKNKKLSIAPVFASSVSSVLMRT